MKKTTRILSLLLALSLCMALLPVAAMAAGDFNIDNKNVVTKYNGPGGHVVIPEGVTGIGESAFYGRKDITGVTIPNTVTHIGLYSFYGCSNLTQITIPDSVTFLNEGAFASTGLTSVVIPDNMTYVGVLAFSGCTNLKSVVVGSNVRFGGSCFGGCSNLTSVTLKEGITMICDRMFSGCTSLSSIKIPNSVTKIEEYAFSGCTNLRNVDLGNGVQEIHAGVFNRCINLKNLTFPASIKKADYVFWSNDLHLDNVVFSEGIEEFPNLGFASIARLYIPASVTTVKDGAFNNITDVTVYGPAGSYIESYCTLRGIPFVAAATPPEPSAFSDVADSAYYAAPVAWAVKQNITTGTTANTFSPDATCTVAQILTFLYRANGSPAPTAANPFSDVSGSDYYCNAARWAYEHGLVSGSRFNGSAPCTRAMVVTYLWKLAGSPAASGSQFTDVPAEYAPAVAWAVQKNITTGTSPTTFSPAQTCTRGQIVTFLYRAYQ